jgi:hypothetical protein
MTYSQLVMKYIMGLIPFKKLYKLNIDVWGPGWWGWSWQFEKQIQLYE